MPRTVPAVGGTGSIGGWAVAEIEDLRRGFERYVGFAVIFDRSNAERLPKGTKEADRMLECMLSEAEKGFEGGDGAGGAGRLGVRDDGSTASTRRR